ARGGAVERTHDLQERRLARAGGPDDRSQLARLHGEAHTSERLHGTGVRLHEISDLEHRRHAGTTTFVPFFSPLPVISTKLSAYMPGSTRTSRVDPSAFTT